ncbi:MAG: amidohydrolase [Congregibacter sp.]
MQDLKVLLVQSSLVWESPSENRAQFAAVLEAANLAQKKLDLIVLPEMFNTGFSMNAESIAEDPEGETRAWMQEVANTYDCALAGSVATRVSSGVANRLWFITPDQTHHYDKRHLFRMSGEHEHYQAGKERVIVPWRGWRIKLEVCYDLRFPVFSRNRDDYDVLLNVANWPAKRSHHWRTLLAARAIENQAYVIAVNRIGSDGSNIEYSGDSLAIDAVGKVLLDMRDRAACEAVSLSADDLAVYREKFPAHRDADEFLLQ